MGQNDFRKNQRDDQEPVGEKGGQTSDDEKTDYSETENENAMM